MQQRPVGNSMMQPYLLSQFVTLLQPPLTLANQTVLLKSVVQVTEDQFHALILTQEQLQT